ncbi:facilitated trehalose transporter Tret1-like [Nesidiocoris tenuis]|uniref:Facilitated trehalose transporter Tret1-like n=1 Tax=Nesidiocoris tenuis TaxID=355587 RepID=A0ABN7B3J5_9HEMI|nr:facilitated trehalose transporter Tret1-like [Nesidiocoris tenuis]
MVPSRSLFRQYLAAFVGGLSIFCSGAAYTWITPLLDRLESPGSVLPLTADQGGWVVTLIEVGNLVGPLPTGILIDRWGRKLSVWINGPIYFLTWIAVLSYKSLTLLYIVRFVQGVAMSIQFTALPLYLAEIGTPDQRGALTSFFQGMWYLGIFCEYFGGKFLDYDGLTWFSLVPTAIFTVLFMYCPETPYYLAMKGREEEAGKSLAWLRAKTPDDQKVKEELKSIMAAVDEEKSQKGSWRDLFGTREGRKAFIIVQIVGMVEMMSGLTTILVYCSQTFAKTSGDASLADDITLAMGGILFLVNVLELFLVERYGRRPLLLISSFGGTLCLIVTTAYYILDEVTYVDMKSYSWILYISLTGVTCLISLGAGALLPVVMGEYFPNSTRGVASGITIFNITIQSCVCLKMYQVVSDNIGSRKTSPTYHPGVVDEVGGEISPYLIKTGELLFGDERPRNTMALIIAVGTKS